MTIFRVNDEEKSLNILTDFGIQYVKPAIENGEVCKLPQLYSRRELKSRLTRLPCTFENQGLTIKLWVLKDLVESKAFEDMMNPTTYQFENIYRELLDWDNLINEK